MNYSSLQLKTIATILFVGANAMNQVNAQTAVPAREATIQTLTPEPLARAISQMYPGQKIVLVTSKEPIRKRTCRESPPPRMKFVVSSTLTNRRRSIAQRIWKQSSSPGLRLSAG